MIRVPTLRSQNEGSINIRGPSLPSNQPQAATNSHRAFETQKKPNLNVERYTKQS